MGVAKSQDTTELLSFSQISLPTNPETMVYPWESLEILKINLLKGIDLIAGKM